MAKHFSARHLYSGIKLENANYLVAPAGLSTPVHMHPRRIHISYTESGKGQCIVEGETYELTTGVLHLVYPNEIHKYIADDKNPYSIYFLHYEWLGEIPSEFPRILKPTKNQRKQIIYLCNEMNHLALYSNSSTSEMRKLALSGLLFAEIIDCTEQLKDNYQQPHPHCPNKKFSDLLHELQTPPFKFSGIDPLAQSMSMSRRKFTDYFRKTTGMSVMEYHLTSKFLYAETLIETGEFSIKQIAFQLDLPVLYANPLLLHNTAQMTP